jgi:hypothetical protein
MICFFTRPLLSAALYLRRYAWHESREPICPEPMGYHNVQIFLCNVPIELEQNCWRPIDLPDIPHDDPRWPSHCTCGYQFKEQDEWQHFSDRLYSDGSRTFPKRELPIGAMYFADWYPRNMFWDNMESDHLFVITPGGEWNIDSRASNCMMPDDRLHRCWVRHGDPETGRIHVDKNGHTCSAGAGSILQPRYHGFLHNGALTG